MRRQLASICRDSNSIMGIAEKQAEREMHYMVEVVTAERERVLKPEPDRNFRVGVVRAHCVQCQEESYQQV